MKRLAPDVARSLKADEELLIGCGGGGLSIGIVTPNPYSVGVVGLSTHILQRVVHETGYASERFYLDAPRDGLRGWERETPAAVMDLLLCSVSYEPDLLTLAAMLSEGGIPVLAEDRVDGLPIVVIGGAAVQGARALTSAMADVVAWGEVESVLPGILTTMEDHRGQSREQLLVQLAKLPGVWVPSVNDSPGVWLADESFSNNPGHSILLTPHGEFGRVKLIEIARGCPHGCKHCSACRAQAPFRVADMEALMELAHQSRGAKLGLVGLAVGEHPQIELILENLLDMGLLLATASLRAESLSQRCLDLLVKSGQFTLTVSPEAGSANLRKMLGKVEAEEEWVSLAEKARIAGFNRLRLYFIVGLPNESDEDLQGIGVLVARIKKAFSRKIAITLAPFVPRPNTPLSECLPFGIKEWTRRVLIVRKSVVGCELKVESNREALLQWQLGQLEKPQIREYLISRKLAEDQALS